MKAIKESKKLIFFTSNHGFLVIFFNSATPKTPSVLHTLVSRLTDGRSRKLIILPAHRRE